MAPIQGRTLNIEPLYEEGCFKFWLPRGGNSAATQRLVRYAAYVTNPRSFSFVLDAVDKYFIIYGIQKKCNQIHRG